MGDNEFWNTTFRDFFLKLAILNVKHVKDEDLNDEQKTQVEVLKPLINSFNRLLLIEKKDELTIVDAKEPDVAPKREDVPKTSTSYSSTTTNSYPSYNTYNYGKDPINNDDDEDSDNGIEDDETKTQYDELVEQDDMNALKMIKNLRKSSWINPIDEDSDCDSEDIVEENEDDDDDNETVVTDTSDNSYDESGDSDDDHTPSQNRQQSQNGTVLYPDMKTGGNSIDYFGAGFDFHKASYGDLFGCTS